MAATTIKRVSMSKECHSKLKRIFRLSSYMYKIVDDTHKNIFLTKMQQAISDMENSNKDKIDAVVTLSNMRTINDKVVPTKDQRNSTVSHKSINTDIRKCLDTNITGEMFSVISKTDSDVISQLHRIIELLYKSVSASHSPIQTLYLHYGYAVMSNMAYIGLGNLNFVYTNVLSFIKSTIVLNIMLLFKCKVATDTILRVLVDLLNVRYVISGDEKVLLFINTFKDKFIEMVNSKDKKQYHSSLFIEYINTLMFVSNCMETNIKTYITHNLSYVRYVLSDPRIILFEYDFNTMATDVEVIYNFLSIKNTFKDNYGCDIHPDNNSNEQLNSIFKFIINIFYLCHVPVDKYTV